MANPSSNEKFFAYYIPENAPIQINDIEFLLKREYNENGGENDTTIVENNISHFDWEFTKDSNMYNTESFLNSLVLVKFTNVKNLFIDSNKDSILKGTNNTTKSPVKKVDASNSNTPNESLYTQSSKKVYNNERIINNEKYILVGNDREYYDRKMTTYCRTSYEHNLSSVFSGNTIIPDNTVEREYILAEVIVIRVKEIIDMYRIHFDNQPNDEHKYFEQSLDNAIKGIHNISETDLNQIKIADYVSKIMIDGVDYYYDAQNSNFYRIESNDTIGKCIGRRVNHNNFTMIDRYYTDNNPNKLTDSRLIKVFQIMNYIISHNNFNNDDFQQNKNTFYQTIQKYFPLIADPNDEDVIQDTIKSLWNAIIDNKLDYDNISLDNKSECLKNNHYNLRNCVSINRCITIGKRIEYEYNVRSSIFAKLYITAKKFGDLDYKDALPFKNSFIIEDNKYTPYTSTQNYALQRIVNLTETIDKLRLQIENRRNVRINQETIIRYQDEVNGLMPQCPIINPDYKNHILSYTFLGCRLLSNHYITNSMFSYLRIISKQFLNDGYFKFQWIHNNTYNRDEINFYIRNDIYEEIIANQFKMELKLFTRIFKIKIKQKFDDNNFEIINYKHNNTYTLPTQKTDSVKLLLEYLDKHIDIKLLQHQKNNILWMLKLENLIDESKLTIPCCYNKHNLSQAEIDDIRGGYLYYLRSNIIDIQRNKYFIEHNGDNYKVDFKKDITVNHMILCSKLLNNNGDNLSLGNISAYNKQHYYKTDNYEYEYEYELHPYNVLDNLVKINDVDNISENVEFCGGALCDEVGLGKTLSIISLLVAKMNDDIQKYNIYKSKMDNITSNTIPILDPINSGFEFNNLIIVPSRLTSQWQTEIEKYINGKFKLRVKVLTSISHIKNLEKELNEHNKQNLLNNTTSSKTVKTIKKKGKQSSEPSNTIKPIIKTNIAVIPDNMQIEIKEINDDLKEIDGNISKSDANPVKKPKIVITKKTKEQRMIEKLMAQAKKANADKHKNTNISLNESGTSITLNSILEANPDAPVQSFTDNINQTINILEEIPEPEPMHEPEQIQESEPIPDEFEFIKDYLGNDNDTDTNDTNPKCDYYNDQLYDIYIVSINLLSNDNYLMYLDHDEQCHIGMINDIKDSNLFGKICRASDKFDIFKIKWNRVILDEAHEKLNPVIKQLPTSLSKYQFGKHKLNYDDQFLYENLASIKSNYKWAMTGTPSQNGIDSIMGILQFLTKRPYNEPRETGIQNIRYFANLAGITSANLDKLLEQIFKKTLKKDIKKELNIPIFTEEIINVEQTNIERNIYNSIRASRHFREEIKLRRLFLMCTNILINEGYDFDTEHDLPTSTEILSLEELNANMISGFNKQLASITNQEQRLTQQQELLNTRSYEWQNIIDYIQTLNLETIIPAEILADIRSLYGSLEIRGSRNILEIVYNLLNMFEAYKTPENAGLILYTNLLSLKTTIQQHYSNYGSGYGNNRWKITWENEPVLNQFAQWGSQLGIVKCTEEISKIQPKLETIINDKRRITNQIALFSNDKFLKEKTADPCIICFMDFESDSEVVITPCRHVFCLNCTKQLSRDLKHDFNCPECRSPTKCGQLNITTLAMINGAAKPEPTPESTAEPTIPVIKTVADRLLGDDWRNKCINKYGSKMAKLVEYLYELFENPQNRVIIFSQYDKMLNMIGRTLDDFHIKYVYCKGNNFVVNKNITRFKKDESIRIIMLSSETSNSGANLTEANHILMIDVLYHDKQKVMAIEHQAIGRAVRLGQKLPVKVVRFITQNTVESEHFEKNKYDMSSLQE